ncbi:SMI1/KNR4 family protein [Listeria sp. FSL L7-1582]|uniref:SMI1/KNR4 family protein n=1 Tax=Listeria portnoyi TaxID=2713504 RepID=UPI00164DF4A9|nr:SMI1/KNR4 family protein [Listeria portnoyi]MBC6309914.1 SMI1/KNR4 family protein [Listeria portnoyi]
MSKIEWQFADEAVSLEDVLTVQKNLGVKFPSDYVECVQINNGASLEPELFELETGVEKVFGTLLSFDNESDEFILDVFNDYKATLPADVIPFAFDPAGNLICFDYRNNQNNPTVVYWNHENAGAKEMLMTEEGLDMTQVEELSRENLTDVAPTFTAFLDKIHD